MNFHYLAALLWFLWAIGGLLVKRELGFCTGLILSGVWMATA